MSWHTIYSWKFYMCTWEECIFYIWIECCYSKYVPQNKACKINFTQKAFDFFFFPESLCPPEPDEILSVSELQSCMIPILSEAGEMPIWNRFSHLLQLTNEAGQSLVLSTVGVQQYCFRYWQISKGQNYLWLRTNDLQLKHGSILTEFSPKPFPASVWAFQQII